MVVWHNAFNTGQMFIRCVKQKIVYIDYVSVGLDSSPSSWYSEFLSAWS